MSEWPVARARVVMAALLRIGWTVKRQTGSHRVLARQGWPDLVFAFHDRDEIGPRMLARIVEHSGLRPEHLYPSARALRPPSKSCCGVRPPSKV